MDPDRPVNDERQVRAHCSRELQPPPRQDGDRDRSLSARPICEAEANKAAVYEVQGESPMRAVDLNGAIVDLNRSFAHSVMVDEEFLAVAAHVDESLRLKIVNCEYVDFSKLLPRDRVAAEEDNRMEMINQGGQTFWVPAKDRNGGAISNYSRWEQAFRVYSDIFTRQHPHKATELIQYGHTISTAALTYQWDNVYMYDRDFRMHISKHPQRSWSVILQQSWAMRLKDKIMSGNGGNNSDMSARQGKRGGGSGKRPKVCFPFNRGECTYGFSCKFEHRCLGCGKFGHGAHNCRRLQGKNAGLDKGNRDGRFGPKGDSTIPKTL